MALRPRVLEREEGRITADPWMERIAWLMDRSIPIGSWSIGLDGLLGLVPGFGDAAGSLVSMFIVMRAVSAGVPRVAVARMVANIAIDSVLGTVPVAGDLFDFAYKANTKNVRIFYQSLAAGHTGKGRHWGFFALLALGLAAIVAIPVALAVWLMGMR